MPENPPRMTRSIVLAGLLGGLLGGLASFAATRMIAPSVPSHADATKNGEGFSEARQVAETFMAKVRAGKPDELASEVMKGLWLVSDQEFASFLGQFTADRKRFAGEFGDPTGQMELVREAALSPSILRLIYLEKYPRDGVLWFLVMYHTMDGWRLIGVTWKEKLAAAVGTLD
jgi:hypothetical protein